ncbi:MAG: 23S rRNA (adenine(2503)-C(2))-methyltransferase RlmN, partial [Planctomycetota bacterium]
THSGRGAPRALTDLSPDEVHELVAGLGEKPFRARQLIRRAWRSGARTFDDVTELSKELRARMARELPFRALGPAGEVTSADGRTTKRLHATHDGHESESVWMAVPASGTTRARLTVCVSSQIGCAFRCEFCASGRGGLVRGLRAAEIAEQAVAADGSRPSHVVVMGMGEPLANYDEVMRAIRTWNAPWGPRIGQRRITVSTIGVVPGIRRLAGEGLELELAVSLHAPNDEIRRRLCPGAPSTVAQVLRAARAYSEKTKRLVTFEYILARGVNDSPACARELASLLAGTPAKVNLIPANPVAPPAASPADARSGSRAPEARSPEGPQQQPETQLVIAPPSKGVARRFLEALASAGVPATVRRERGADVNAACGQLRWRRMVADPASDGPA